MLYNIATFRLVALLVFQCLFSARLNGQPIREIDFANFIYTLPRLGPDETPGFRFLEIKSSAKIDRIELVNGKQTRVEADGFTWFPVELISTQFGDLDGDGRDEAVVVLDQYGGGTMRWGFVLVFTQNRVSAIHEMARFMTGDRASEGLRRAKISRGELVLDINMFEDSIADCCATLFRRIYLRWNGMKFLKVGEQRRLVVDDHPP